MSIDIKRDKQTGRNLGYGFIQMGSHEEACEAKRRLHEAEISGRKIRIGWAQRNTALFVGKSMTTTRQACTHLSACLLVCLPVSRPTCLPPAYLLACLPAVDLSTYLLAG